MTARSRVLTYGTAGALAIAGVACVAAFDGLVAEVAAIALITLGLGAVVLLLFFEVGLSEDRERAEEERRRERPKRRQDGPPRLSLRRRPRRPS